MKKPLLYNSLLLLLIILVAAFLLKEDLSAMPMPQLFSICALLVIYTVALSLVGEIKPVDERDLNHRYIANRLALIAGTAILSGSILYKLFHHTVDMYLLAALIAMNLTKILTLVYCHYHK